MVVKQYKLSLFDPAIRWHTAWPASRENDDRFTPSGSSPHDLQFGEVRPRGGYDVSFLYLSRTWIFYSPEPDFFREARYLHHYCEDSAAYVAHGRSISDFSGRCLRENWRLPWSPALAEQR
jgi:hypothetical protein